MSTDQIRHNTTETEGGDIMAYVAGSKTSFRCDNVEGAILGYRGQCGCNVFRRKKGDASRLVCNACGAVFITEVTTREVPE